MRPDDPPSRRFRALLAAVWTLALLLAASTAAPVLATGAAHGAIAAEESGDAAVADRRGGVADRRLPRLARRRRLGTAGHPRPRACVVRVVITEVLWRSVPVRAPPSPPVT